MDLLCFSHLRWDFVFQRPQHLLSRAAKTMRVFYLEEPIWLEHCEAGLTTRMTDEGVVVVQPQLPWGADDVAVQRGLLDRLVAAQRIVAPTLWYYTPAALRFSSHIEGRPVVYDCMDELSAFAGADPELPSLERALLDRADLVFTGGRSLFEAKRRLHPAVHAFPSGVDVGHFRPARDGLPDPVAQRMIAHPRAGFFGVIDERLDRTLLDGVAALRPSVQFVMLGPVAKLDLDELPRRPNIHWLGPAAYRDLPAYIAHWDVALMPFARNDATRFISPTKTPEYLAAGRPVVSTPIADVVHEYGGLRSVGIAADAPAFAAAIDHALGLPRDSWVPEADAVLNGMSWDSTWQRMEGLMREAALAAE